jgi:hypothetical protein
MCTVLDATGFFLEANGSVGADDMRCPLLDDHERGARQSRPTEERRNQLQCRAQQTRRSGGKGLYRSQSRGAWSCTKTPIKDRASDKRAYCTFFYCHTCVIELLQIARFEGGGISPAIGVVKSMWCGTMRNWEFWKLAAQAMAISTTIVTLFLLAAWSAGALPPASP